jgi:hypothetical protein
MRRLLFIVVAILVAPPARAEPPLVLDGQLGPAFLIHSRSHAVGHAFKPAARFGLRRPVTDRLEVGGSVSGLVDASAHYRVVGALAHARFALWQRPVFSLGGALALGAGYDADILHSDLRATRSPVIPYGFVALDARWSIARRWLIGAEAGWENLSMVRLGALFGFALDGGVP